MNLREAEWGRRLDCDARRPAHGSSQPAQYALVSFLLLWLADLDGYSLDALLGPLNPVGSTA